MNLNILLPFSGYFLLVILIGVLSTKFSSRGISEFLVGGRSMSRFVVAASSIVRDIYEKIINKEKTLSQKHLTFLSRIVIVVLVIISVVMGIIIEELVFWFVLFAWAGLGAAIGPTSLLALFWKKTSAAGIIAGLIAGTVTVFVWKTVPVLSNSLYELIPAFIVSFSVTIIFSIICRE